ncbi:BTAD domain-containing putative transcriptional regulator [Streptomyces phyllanthi]|uniref:OmpR/PhoB-type domain-containing protein n=1 Tax=Streptomyces phyllanthi TaxID=1803180 RepID=A0A5N8VX62_9ACTN|nr:AfsR/SARP family transcriptional regulator [Streptomyces phyllanthi]MPY38638.1 hypothetical protein [Streptomyces phyllanthi]
MQVRLLGPVEVRRDGVCPRLGGPLQRSLLAVLTLHANRAVSRSRLTFALWGDDPPMSVEAQLHQRVSRLRAVVGRKSIVRSVAGYVLTIEPTAVDVEMFDLAVGKAREAMIRGEAEEARRGLDEALRLWRGPALGGVAEHFARVEGPAVEERRLAAVELRAEAGLELGRHAELLGELKTLVAEHPLRERPRGHLMLALHRCGRTAEALEVYREGRDHLVHELGVEPGAGLRATHAAILADTQMEPPVAGIQTEGPRSNVAPLPCGCPSQAPAQLPPDIADFTGRTAEAHAVTSALSRSGTGVDAMPVMVISGPGGVGKTALAIHAGHQLAGAFPGGQLYANLHASESARADPPHVLAQFLSALGTPRTSLPDSHEGLTALFRSVTAQRHMLIVLDDAADEAQVRSLLPGNPNCAVLITSRVRLTGLEGARRIDVDVFDPEDAGAFLGRVEGRRRTAADPEASAELIRLCGCLPLAIRIAGAKLAARPHWDLRQFATLLSDERRRLDELVAGDLELRASLALSYGTLSQEARAACHMLARLPVPEFTAVTCAELMGVPMRVGERVTEQLLDAWLIKVSRVSPTGQTRYRFAELVRAYAREQFPGEQAPVESVSHRDGGHSRARESAPYHPLAGVGMIATP